MTSAADPLDDLYPLWVLTPDPSIPIPAISMRPGGIIRTQRPAEVRFISAGGQAWMRAAFLLEACAS